MSSLSVPVFKPCVSIGFVLIFFPVVFEFLTLTQLLKSAVQSVVVFIYLLLFFLDDMNVLE